MGALQKSSLLGLAVVFTCYSSAFSFEFSELKKLATSTLSALKLKNADNPKKLFDFQCKDIVRELEFKDLLQIILKASNSQTSLESLKSELRTTPWLPISFEKVVGETIINKNLQRGLIIPPTDPNYRELYSYLKKESEEVLRDIKLILGNSKELPYDFKFFIYDSMEKNAFSLPGGYIVVSKRIVKGALREENRKKNSYRKRDFLKFTLAHEVSHNLRRHYSLKTQDIILNAIKDKNDLQQLLLNLKSSYQVLNLSLFSKEDKKRVGEKLKQLQNKVSYLLQLFNRGLETMSKKKRESYRLYGNFEKEADACALKILSQEYPYLQLQRVVENVLKELPEVDYLNCSRKKPDDSIVAMAKAVGENLSKIFLFYATQHNFIHPASEERGEFLIKVLKSYSRNQPVR